MSTSIKLARIDKRLLHATVALNWNNLVNANYVIVVDPQHINDPFIEQVMQLCLPKSMKVKIFNVDNLLDFISEEGDSHRNVMIIFKDIETAGSAVEAGFRVKEFQLPYPASRILIKNLTDYYSEKEVEVIRYIQQQGIKLYFQTAPTDNKEYAIFTK